MAQTHLDIINNIQQMKTKINDLEEKLEKQTPVLIQNGLWEITDGYDHPNIISKPVTENKLRSLSKQVIFKKPFLKEPKIYIGLAHIDAEPNKYSLIINTKTKDITKKGFTLTISTWVTTRIYGFRIEWLAYTI